MIFLRVVNYFIFCWHVSKCWARFSSRMYLYRMWNWLFWTCTNVTSSLRCLRCLLRSKSMLLCGGKKHWVKSLKLHRYLLVANDWTAMPMFSEMILYFPLPFNFNAGNSFTVQRFTTWLNEGDMRNRRMRSYNQLHEYITQIIRELALRTKSDLSALILLGLIKGICRTGRLERW